MGGEVYRSWQKGRKFLETFLKARLRRLPGRLESFSPDGKGMSFFLGKRGKEGELACDRLEGGRAFC